MHKAVHFWEKGKKNELDEFMNQSKIASQADFWQFCQAVSETLLVGNREKRLIEGFLLSMDKQRQEIKKPEIKQPKLALTDFLEDKEQS